MPRPPTAVAAPPRAGAALVAALALVAVGPVSAEGEPGTAEFRKSLRDAIFSTREVVGTHGVYNFKPGSLDGVDERARVIVTLDQGQWKLVP